MYNLNINHYTECLIFGLLRFNDEIKNISREFIKNNFANKTIGLHIRRTDHVILAKRKGNFTSDKFFFNIISKELEINPDTKFYLATDNIDTQNIFITKYPNNILIRHKIEKSDNSWRNTTLKDAGIDLYILSHCHHIEGSFHSSFSRIAVMLNLHYRKQLENAEEELNKYVFRTKNYN